MVFFMLCLSLLVRPTCPYAGKKRGRAASAPPLVTAVQTVVPRNCDEDDEGNMQKRSYAM